MDKDKLKALGDILKKLEEVEEDDNDVSDTNSSASDALRENGIYYITGEIKSGSLKIIQEDILLKHFKGPKFWDKPIQLLINSPGGDADEANALLDVIANVRMDVRTTAMGMCASAAAELVASGTKGMRLVSPSTTIMVHRYTWGSYDKQPELVARRPIEDATHNHMVEFWREHSKYKSNADVEKHLLKTVDNWMTAKQALDHGIVDAITAKLR
jgi:ATP-dependent Clp protease protease subunit